MGSARDYLKARVKAAEESALHQARLVVLGNLNADARLKEAYHMGVLDGIEQAMAIIADNERKAVA